MTNDLLLLLIFALGFLAGWLAYWQWAAWKTWHNPSPDEYEWRAE